MWPLPGAESLGFWAVPGQWESSAFVTFSLSVSRADVASSRMESLDFWAGPGLRQSTYFSPFVSRSDMDSSKSKFFGFLSRAWATSTFVKLPFHFLYRGQIWPHPGAESLGLWAGTWLWQSSALLPFHSLFQGQMWPQPGAESLGFWAGPWLWQSSVLLPFHSLYRGQMWPHPGVESLGFWTGPGIWQSFAYVNLPFHSLYRGQMWPHQGEESLDFWAVHGQWQFFAFVHLNKMKKDKHAHCSIQTTSYNSCNCMLHTITYVWALCLTVGEAFYNTEFLLF